MKKELEKYMNENGIKMYKLIDGGGIFSNTTYDYKFVYSIKEMQNLLKDGYEPDRVTLGAYLFNVILSEK
jgi:hypothetical protein